MGFRDRLTAVAEGVAAAAVVLLGIEAGSRLDPASIEHELRRPVAPG